MGAGGAFCVLLLWVSGLRGEFAPEGDGGCGAGWVWCLVGDGKLAMASPPSRDWPYSLSGVGKAVLGLDVWEHAYYLKYQNRRPDYIKEWWHTVNWDKAAELYSGAKK